MKQIAVIAGTSEATELIYELYSKFPEKYTITAFVATDYGKAILEGTNCNINVGRLDKKAFRHSLNKMDLVIDASHPFAIEVTKTVKEVCKHLNIMYIHLGRQIQKYDYDNIIYVKSKEDAVKQLLKIKGNILLTTGVNTLSFYESNIFDFAVRGWVRILDTADSRKIAKNSKANIIYGMPPFSENDTIFLIHKYSIAVLVSKDSGTRGGVKEKVSAAKSCHIPIILIEAPKENVIAIQKVIDIIKNIE